MSIPSEISIELLKALHILTRDGKLNSDSNRKLKQVHHLSQLIEPLLKKLFEPNPDFTLVDLGAGKSYLGFILYDRFFKNLEQGYIVSIESRGELIEKSKTLAQNADFKRMEFVQTSIENARLQRPVHLVCALHACDTATDDAILFGLQHQASGFALVPCCQAEVARQLKSTPSNALHDFPLHQREFGSHLTNVIRTLFLQSHGYRVTVTELVGWEHSMKNELILAEKISDPTYPKSIEAKQKLDKLLAQFPVKPKLLSTSFTPKS